MANEQESAARPVDLEGGEFLESETAFEERLPERQFCVFRAGRERFCLSVLEVEEVVDWPIVTRVPLAPAFLMGVFNLRGTIVPLVDIAFTEGRRPGLSMWWWQQSKATRSATICGWASQPTK